MSRIRRSGSTTVAASDTIRGRICEATAALWGRAHSMLTVRELRVTYGGAVQALRGISLSVAEGEVVAVLGSNGAGKTTLLRAISSTLRMCGGHVTGGTLEFEGRQLDGLAPAEVVDGGIVQVPEGRRIFTRLTVEENLRAGGYSVRDRRQRSAARRRVLELFPILWERADQRAGLLSGGEQQMLAIGRALMSSPRLLLLDEPSLGLAPLVVGRIGEIVAEINRQGTTVLLVEQNTTMALEVAARAFVLDLGQVSLTGTAAELSASTEVRDLYLGHGGERAVAEATSATGTTARRRLGAWVP
jgi:branched-chain amino acid transport system ATP-binding protein